MKNQMFKIILKVFACAFFLSSQTHFLQAYTLFDSQYLIDNCPGCDLCDDCSPWCYDPFWMEAEYLFCKINDSPRIPPLVFTGIFDPAIIPTILTPGTSIVLGDRVIKDQGRSGGRFLLGYNFSFENIYSSEVSYIVLTKHRSSKSVRSNDYREDKVTFDEFPDNSYLAIPFLDATTGNLNSVFIAQPGSFAGRATVKTTNWMQGVEWNFTRVIGICSRNMRLRAVAGFRYWNFNDKLKFFTFSPDTTTPDVFKTVDEFHVINNFYGGQIGFDAEYFLGCFSFNVKAKIALGGINQQLSIDGNLFTNDFNGFDEVIAFPGGYFAQQSNIGNFEKNRFAYIPEVNFNVKYQILDCFRFQLGYSFMYVSKVFWAEDQIDTVINPTQSVAINRSPFVQLSGPPRPKALRKTRDFWLQGFNAGFEYHF